MNRGGSPVLRLASADAEFAARQILGEPSVAPGGRAITPHAAERMVSPPKGRSAMSVEEVDRVPDSGTKIRKCN